MNDAGASAPDGHAMRAALEDLPRRLAVLAAGGDLSDALPSLDALDGVMICAAGDDAIDVDVVTWLASSCVSVPVEAHRGGTLPAWVGSGWLVVVVALARDDGRRIELADAAVEVGASVVVISSHADLLEVARANGAVAWPIEATVREPRLLPGVVLVLVLRLFERVGVTLEADLDGVIGRAEAVTTECARVSDGRKRSEPAALARRTGRTLPIIYGAEGIGGVAATWWKSAVNQSAKFVAFAADVPAMAHAELSMFGQGGDVTRQVFTMVLLRAPLAVEGTLAASQLERFDELFGEVVAEVETVRTEATGLAAYLDLSIRGQWLGLELAALAGVDPGAVSISNEFWAHTPT